MTLLSQKTTNLLKVFYFGPKEGRRRQTNENAKEIEELILQYHEQLPYNIMYSHIYRLTTRQGIFLPLADVVKENKVSSANLSGKNVRL